MTNNTCDAIIVSGDMMGRATSIKVYDDDMIIINLTAWENVDALRVFVYKSVHYGVLRDRKRWFEKLERNINESI